MRSVAPFVGLIIHTILSKPLQGFTDYVLISPMSVDKPDGYHGHRKPDIPILPRNIEAPYSPLQ